MSRRLEWDDDDRQPTAPSEGNQPARADRPLHLVAHRARTSHEIWGEDEGTVPPPPAEAGPPTSSASLWDEGVDGGSPAQAIPAHPAPPPPPPAPVAPPPVRQDETLEGLWDAVGRSDKRRLREPLRRRAAPTPAKLARRKLAKRVTILVVVALVADAIWIGYGLTRSLPPAATDLLDARAAITAGDLGAARRLLERAHAGASSGSALTNHPAFQLVRPLPVVGAEVQAIDALADGGRLAAEAGIELLAAAERLGVDSNELTSGIYRDGKIDLARLDRAAPLLAAAADLLAQADDALTSAPIPAVDLLRERIGEARRRVASAALSAHRGDVLFQALPSLVGGSEPRRYLLAFQALGEARATGGMMGFFGVLWAVDGDILLDEIAPVREGFPTEPDEIRPVDAPAWFEDNYGSQSALVQAQQTNTSPNFPVVAETWLEMFEAKTGTELDGVIAMDPVSLQEMLRGTGPISAPGLDVDVGPDNAAQVLMYDSYVELPTDSAQNAYLRRLLQTFWQKVSDGDFKPVDFVTGVGAAASTSHLKIYSRDDATQDKLVELGVDGDFTDAGPNVQMVFTNNYGPTKLDYFLRRSINTSIALEAQDEARIRTTVTLKNTAPADVPDGMLGPNAPDQGRGTNRMSLNFLLPKGAAVVDYEIGGEERAPYDFSDSGHPVVWDVVELGPGEETTATLTYLAPAFYSDDRYTITLFPQTRSTPDRYRLKVRAPDGFLARRARGVGEGLIVTRQTGRLESEVSTELDLFPR